MLALKFFLRLAAFLPNTRLSQFALNCRNQPREKSFVFALSRSAAAAFFSSSHSGNGTSSGVDPGSSPRPCERIAVSAMR